MDETNNLPVADETSTYTWKNGDTFTGNCTQILRREANGLGIITYKDDGTENTIERIWKLVRATGVSTSATLTSEESWIGKFASANKTTKKHDDSSPPRHVCATRRPLPRRET